MSKVLFVNACMRGEESRTLQLCKEYLATKESFTELNLSNMQLLPFSGDMVAKRTFLQLSQQYDESIFDLARQFAQAEEIVIGAPYWDLSFPAALKIYIEHISVSDVTFQLTDRGEYVGLCKAKHITYITSCGGFIAEGANLGYEYVQGIANMFGIPEVRFVVAEGLDVIGLDLEGQMQKAREALSALD
ncbi:MAG: NAD(P)H-dependent oxidoreductase [Raoultibacter sp.]